MPHNQGRYSLIRQNSWLEIALGAANETFLMHVCFIGCGGRDLLVKLILYCVGILMHTTYGRSACNMDREGVWCVRYGEGLGASRLDLKCLSQARRSTGHDGTVVFNRCGGTGLPLSLLTWLAFNGLYK